MVFQGAPTIKDQYELKNGGFMPGTHHYLLALSPSENVIANPAAFDGSGR